MVTVSDVLKLPCMSGARVVAGCSGLSRRVTTVSVLEYTDPTPMQEHIFHSLETQANELAICALISVKDDVEAQCDVIRRLASYGDVGMLLYYVGVFVKQLDEKVIRTADALDFVLICMPENDTTLRYSDAIQEIMGAVFRDDAKNSSFVTELLKSISALPAGQRSMDAMLRLLAERTGMAVLLLDGMLCTLNSAVCAGMKREQVQQAAGLLGRTREWSGAAGDLYFTRTVLHTRDAEDLYLAVLQAGEPVDQESAGRMTEAVQLFLNIWSEQHGRTAASELLRALFLDEPLKAHRLAARLNVSLSALHGMLFLCSARREPGRAFELLETARQQLMPGQLLLGDVLDGAVALFVRREVFRARPAFLDAFSEAIHAVDPSAQVFVCYYLADLADARRAWALLREQAELTGRLYPGHRWYSLQEAQFAADCAAVLTRGEQEVGLCLNALAPLDAEEPLLRRDLHRTLAVYLLDAGSNVAETAARMYLHRNTIKYRINKISEDLGYRPDELPESRGCYLAVALERLLGMES